MLNLVEEKQQMLSWISWICLFLVGLEIWEVVAADAEDKFQERNALNVQTFGNRTETERNQDKITFVLLFHRSKAKVVQVHPF